CVATHLFSSHGHRNRTDLDTTTHRSFSAGPEAGEQDGTDLARGVDVEDRRLARDRAEAGTRRARGGKAVADRFGKIGDTPAPIERDEAHPRAPGIRQNAQEYLAATAVLDYVG